MNPHAARAEPQSPGTDPGAWRSAAARALSLGRSDLALEALKTAIRVDPSDAKTWFDYAGAAATANDPVAAEAAYRRVVELLPDRQDVRINVGAMLERRLRFADAAKEYAAAARGDRNVEAALSNLAGVMAAQGRADEAMVVHRRAVRKADPGSRAWSNYLYAQHYVGDLTPERIAADHLAWGARFGAAFQPLTAPEERRRNPGRLRVAYMSPDFRRHSVAYFALPLIAGHDRARVEVWCYMTDPRRDPITDRLQAVADQWIDAGRMDDATLAERIAADGVDVLIDLAGHTAGGRPGVLARRPAPLQAAYLGYPNTTGLDTADLRFTDGEADPAGAGEGLGSERLVRLGRPFLAYAPPEAPAVRERRGRGVVFGSFNALAKANPETIDLWAETLRAVPDSRLLLKAKAFADGETRGRFTALFHARGVAGSRLDLRPHTPGLGDHLETYGEIDIALDTAPYNGATTTMEALWMGVPVITKAGDRHAARVGAAILRPLGLERFVASDRAGFVGAAQRLAGDVDTRTALRRNLRDIVAQSPLTDGRGLARSVENALFAAWT